MGNYTINQSIYFIGGMGILLQERNQSQRNAADCLSDIGEEKMSIYADDLSRMNKNP